MFDLARSLNRTKVERHDVGISINPNGHSENNNVSPRIRIQMPPEFEGRWFAISDGNKEGTICLKEYDINRPFPEGVRVYEAKISGSEALPCIRASLSQIRIPFKWQKFNKRVCELVVYDDIDMPLFINDIPSEMYRSSPEPVRRVDVKPIKAQELTIAKAVEFIHSFIDDGQGRYALVVDDGRIGIQDMKPRMLDL